MRDLFIILTIISVARSLPLPIALGDLDLFSPNLGSDSGLDSGLDSLFDPGLDSYSIGLDDSSQPLFLASSGTETTGSTPENPPTTPKSAPITEGWSVTPPGGDTSWTGRDRQGSSGDWPVTIPAPPSRFTTINSDVNGPTSFELSPDQAEALIEAGVLAVGGVTWLYNSVTGTISKLGDSIGGWMPSIPGF